MSLPMEFKTVALFECGAVDNKEGLRAALASHGMVEINKGFEFKTLHVGSEPRLIFERGAIDDKAKLGKELEQSIVLVEYNKGYRCEVV